MSFTPEQRAELGAMMAEALAAAIPVIVERVVEAIRSTEPEQDR